LCHSELVSTVTLQKRALNLLVELLIGYVLVLLIVRVFESHFVFFPNYPSRQREDWKPKWFPVEDVWLNAADGTKLHSWWIPNDKANLTIVAFHGNAGGVADRAEVYQFLRDTPANVLAVEYRGYGRSDGKPSEAGIYQDAESAYQYLVVTRHIPPKSVVVFGQSLGTAVAAHLAAQHEVAGVILEAPFPSASRVASKVFPFLPGLSLLVHSQFDTQRRVQEINAPILIVHCNQDPVIPFVFGQEVFAASREPKTFLEIDAICHEEASMIAPAKYRTALQSFLSKVPAGNSPTTQ
jgi:uncharacterized protein